jgi:N-acetylglucosamine-6-phosphate deacetylase
MLCIHDASLVLSDRIVVRGWILLEGDLIIAIGQGLPPENHQYLDAEGLYLAPGFIDLHVHGGRGADFLDATPEAFQTAADFHLSGGTTGICPTAATGTYNDYLHLEGPHLAPAKAGAQNAKLMIAPEAKQKDWILSRARSISQVTIAPECSRMDQPWRGVWLGRLIWSG